MQFTAGRLENVTDMLRAVRAVPVVAPNLNVTGINFIKGLVISDHSFLCQRKKVLLIILASRNTLLLIWVTLSFFPK
jgi:hypothetical protein